MDFFSTIINFNNISELLPIVTGSLIAGTILGVLSGVIGVVINARDLAFAVHGTSELSFAGAAAALYFGTSVTNGAIIGSLIAAIALGILGVKAQERNTSIGIMLPFGLGIGVLFLAMYKGRSSNKFGLLAGQIVSVERAELVTLAVIAALVLTVLAIMWRPLYFCSTDPEVAQARGIPMRALSIIFMVLLGLTVAMAVQIVGALLVLSLLITPAAAAAKVTATPWRMVIISTTIAVVAAVGGIILSLGPGLPISPYVTTVSFLCYLTCMAIGSVRSRRGHR